MFVFVQIFVTLFTLTCANHICERLTWGTYCHDDLTGYAKCGAHIWRRGKRVGFRVLHSAKCPTNTRCSCFQGNDCEGYLDIDDVDICQPYEIIYPVKKILHLTYYKSGWSVDDPNEYIIERYEESGEIKQDLKAKSVMYKWKRDGKDKFELFIPDSVGTFVKYVGGYYPNVCEKSTVDNLKVFGDGIKHFTLKKRVVISKGLEKQILESHIYNLDGTGLSKIWTVVAKDKRITHGNYSESNVGSNIDQCCDSGENIRYVQVPYDESVSTDHWFTVPGFCP